MNDDELNYRLRRIFDLKPVEKKYLEKPERKKTKKRKYHRKKTRLSRPPSRNLQLNRHHPLWPFVKPGSINPPWFFCTNPRAENRFWNEFFDKLLG